MVDIEEMEEEATTTMTTTPSQSQERLLDAEEIEKVAAKMTRPTAQMHLTALAKKLRKEGEALKRVEANIAKTTEQQEQPVEQAQQPQEPPPMTTATKPMPRSVAAVPPTSTVVVGSSVKFSPIDRFSFDAGSYNTPFITLYIPLPGVGSIPKANVVCDFGKDSLNLVVTDLNGKSFRLIKDSLEKDIVPDKSKCIIKANEIRIKLAKVKGEYGSFDYWSKLTDPKKHDKKKAGGAASSDNPTAGIMDLMKDMYDSGDDNMKKMIGETMMKQRNGELTDPMSMGGMGGTGGSKKKGGAYGMGLDDLNMDDDDDEDD
jgi:calcyclin binding protein